MPAPRPPEFRRSHQPTASGCVGEPHSHSAGRRARATLLPVTVLFGIRPCVGPM